VELTLEKFFNRGCYALATASLFESRYTAKDNGERNTLFNNNYIFNVLGGKEFYIRNNVLGFNFKYTHIGGQRYTPILGEQLRTDDEGNPVINPLTGEAIVDAPLDWYNAFSKKIENLEHAVALHFMYYNFARPHKSLANPYPRTPAMAAEISDHIWTIEDIVKLID